MKKKIFTFLLALAASAGTIFAQSGYCGKNGTNVTWTLNDSVLTIDGAEDMADWSGGGSSVPSWYAYREQIKSVIIKVGVSSIGNCAFSNYANLKSVTMPNSISTIGNNAFIGCIGLTSITLSNALMSIGISAFQNTSLTSVTIPATVESIGYRAFVGSQLTNISVESGSNYYSSKDGVLFNKDKTTLVQYPNGKTATSYTIPSSVYTIGDHAFAYCDKLISVTIPNGVAFIDSEAFYQCTGLKTITLPASVANINFEAFGACVNVSLITCEATTPPTLSGANSFKYLDQSIPVLVPAASVEAYRADAQWQYFSNIQSMNCGSSLTWTLVDGVLTVSGSGFMANFGTPFGTENLVPWIDCRSKIKMVVIESGVTTIGENAFFGCDELFSVSIPTSVETIGLSAFEDCKILPNVTIPNSVTSIGYKAFATVMNIAYKGTATGSPWGARSLNGYVSDYLWVYGDESETNLRVCSPAATGAMDIPSTVKSFSAAAFSGCSGLTSVTIPKGVKSIDDYTFYGCSGLTSFTLPASIETIGDYAFFGCSGLTSLTCLATTPPNWTGGSSTTFKHVTMSIPLYVPSESIDAYKAHNEWKQFTNIQPASCTRATGTCGASGDNLTWELSCDGVLTISGTGAMKDLDYNASSFWKGYISYVKSVVIENGVTSIGSYAFPYCTELTSVDIPSTVQSIGESAFKSCDKLTSVDIPNSVTSIGASAFYGCTSLASVTMPNSVTSIGVAAFLECSALTSPVYNANVFAYMPAAYSGAYTIQDGIKSIAAGAFAYCSGMTALTIPASVTSIGASAFYGCTGLASITSEAVNPPACGDGCFSNVDKSIPVYVPAGSKAAYQAPAATGWNEFTNIQEVGDPVVPTGIAYELVDLSSETLNADKYIIVFDDNKAHAEVGGSQNKDLIASSDELEFSLDGNYAYVPEAQKAACEVTIALLGTGEYSILLAGDTVYLDLQTKNSVTTSKTASGFSITDGGDQTVQISKVLASDSKTYVLKYNSSNDGYFRMYSNNLYTLPRLYRLKEVPTEIETVDNGQLTIDIQKFIRDGQLFIERDGKVYTVTGQEVR